MQWRVRLRPQSRWQAAVLGASALACFVLLVGNSGLPSSSLISQIGSGRPNGQPQLLSVEPLPPMNGPLCEWLPVSLSAGSWNALEQRRPSPQPSGSPHPPAYPPPTEKAEVQKRLPLRVIRDPYPAFSSVAVDPDRDEVVFTDENLFQVLVYDRIANTPAGATITEPKRIIGGLNTKIEFNCDVYVDPKNGDIYTISHDSEGMPLTVFDRTARGNVSPVREIDTPKGTYGLAVDEQAEEIFMSIQHDSAVVVFKKYGERDEPPIRLLQGDKTLLGDAHGIALDTKRGEMFVSNYGYSSSRDSAHGDDQGRASREKPNWPLQRSVAIPGTGKILPPSINVYPLKAKGDIPPLRLIQGPKTQLDMPSHLYVDEERGELYVANDMGDSILVFDANADGNVSPTRVLKGPQTLIQNPTGLFVDIQNDELWVANFGAHAGLVFRRTAEGNTPPLRVIRNGPMDAPSLMIGNPGAIGYDTKREEILVPN